MLTRFKLQDWKSFGSGDKARNEILFGQVTLLVGPNASGKSNLLDALRFLQGAALDFPLADVLRGRWEGQRQLWPGIRGGIVEAARQGKNRFSLISEWLFENDNATPLQHCLAVSVVNEPAVTEERLWDLGTNKRFLFDTHPEGVRGTGPHGGNIPIWFASTGRGKRASADYSSARALLPQASRERQGRVRPDVIQASSALGEALREMVFLDIQPAMMRSYRPIGSHPIGTSGENVSPVLYGLREQQERLADIVSWLSELCAPGIEAIDFDKTQLGEVMMFVIEQGTERPGRTLVDGAMNLLGLNGRNISARSLSDGTLRFLGLLVALLTSPPGTLMVLEEPDVGLHPSRIRLLAELFEHLAKKQRIQILAATHSPTLIAHLSDQALGDVVAFGRDRESGCTVCSRLADLPNFEVLRSSRDVAHLISTGWLERAL